MGFLFLFYFLFVFLIISILVLKVFSSSKKYNFMERNKTKQKNGLEFMRLFDSERRLLFSDLKKKKT